jgi:RNA polymerase sigma-70 factor (ECF subfamily)
MDQVTQDQLSRAYHEHRGPLLRLLTARTGDRGEAEDLLQELWIKLQRSPQVEVREARAYLFRMAQNLVMDSLRTRRRREERDRRWSDEASGWQDSTRELPDERRTAEQEMLAREEAALLASAISNLPDGARRAFELHKIEGASHAEVAVRLGISRSGVEKHMAVAMKHIKRVLLD